MADGELAIVLRISKLTKGLTDLIAQKVCNLVFMS